MSKRRSKLSSRHLSGSSRIWADSLARKIKGVYKPLNATLNILFMTTILIPKKKRRKTKKNKERLREARKLRRKKRKCDIEEMKLFAAINKKKRSQVPSQDQPVIRDSPTSPRSFERFVRAVLVRKK